jgi:uncharacterized protein
MGKGLHQQDFLEGRRMNLLERVAREGIVPEVTRPAATKLLAGDPVHTTWNLEDRDGLFCGLWQSTPGLWQISYTEWEYMHILQGVSVITDDRGHAVTLRAGDSYVIRPGFVGTWQVVETTLKDYVILL